MILRRYSKRPLSALLVGAALLGFGLQSGEAKARARHESRHSYQQTFGTALRLLKVDMDFEVTEINADWGYLLFVYTNPESGDRKNRGSFTFVQVDGGVQIALQIPTMPSYHEQIIVDKLRYKLTAEHGDAPEPSKEKPKKKRSSDDEADKDKKDGDKPQAP